MTCSSYDKQALEGAAEFFEQIATNANPEPLAFAQAIRRALPPVQASSVIAGLRSERITAERDALEAYRKLQAAEARISSLEEENKRLREALDEIEELNLSAEDENGHRWANSDMIAQTITLVRPAKEGK